jgi:hypothetical protein
LGENKGSQKEGHTWLGRANRTIEKREEYWNKKKNG